MIEIGGAYFMGEQGKYGKNDNNSKQPTTHQPTITIDLRRDSHYEQF
jgi:hypothetical protein